MERTQNTEWRVNTEEKYVQVKTAWIKLYLNRSQADVNISEQ